MNDWPLDEPAPSSVRAKGIGTIWVGPGDMSDTYSGPLLPGLRFTLSPALSFVIRAFQDTEGSWAAGYYLPPALPPPGCTRGTKLCGIKGFLGPGTESELLANMSAGLSG
jgi:hypothetical protein